MAALSSNPLVGKTVCDFQQLGLVLAARHRLGLAHVYDVRERAKARRAMKRKTA